MTSTLVHNIGQLVTNDSQHDGTKLGVIEKAALLIEDGVVAWAGPDSDAPTHHIKRKLDAKGRAVIPGFVDSHTHMIFAGDRSKEFRARMLGESYTAGGIAHTVEKTRAASDELLRSNAQSLINEAYSSGTTTIEIKSGYGLSVEDERRSLEIAQGLTDETTFLGAHVVPVEYRKNPKDYVDLVTGPMLDAVLPFSKWIDVFCDKGAFLVDDARTILKAGIAKGLLPRCQVLSSPLALPILMFAHYWRPASLWHLPLIAIQDLLTQPAWPSLWPLQFVKCISHLSKHSGQQLWAGQKRYVVMTSVIYLKVLELIFLF